MTRTIARQMTGADILKLRRHRPTMTTAALLSIGITALYFVTIIIRHNGELPGAQSLSDATSILGLFFGSFAAILIGTEAGTIDRANGVFRDLAATGRSRTMLFLTRIPAAISVAVAFTLGGFLLSLIPTFAFHGTATAPGPGLVIESAAWVVLATAVVTTLSVGVGSLTGSRSVTLTVIIGWQTIATLILYNTSFLGAARDLVLNIALGSLLPGSAIGTHANPSSSIALPNYKLAMPTAVSVLVILAWAVVPTVAGAWRTRTEDA